MNERTEKNWQESIHGNGLVVLDWLMNDPGSYEQMERWCEEQLDKAKVPANWREGLTDEEIDVHPYLAYYYELTTAYWTKVLGEAILGLRSVT